MKLRALFTAAALTAPLLIASGAAHAQVTHVPVSMPPGSPPMPGGMSPPFSAAVQAGNTIYVAGTTDGGDAAAKIDPTAAGAAKRVLDNIKRTVEASGATMDDLVWVQIFCSDLSYYQAFNDTYRTYFKGPMPARAFLGVDHLLGGAKFEVMGIAVKK